MIGAIATQLKFLHRCRTFARRKECNNLVITMFCIYCSSFCQLHSLIVRLCQCIGYCMHGNWWLCTTCDNLSCYQLRFAVDVRPYEGAEPPVLASLNVKEFKLKVSKVFLPPKCWFILYTLLLVFPLFRVAETFLQQQFNFFTRALPQITLF